MKTAFAAIASHRRALMYILFMTVGLISYQQCSPVNFTATSSLTGKLGDDVGGLPICGNGVTSSCIDEHESCGDHRHGDTWYQQSEDTESVTEDCEFGADSTSVYAIDEQLRCNDGSVEHTGSSRRGDPISLVACANQPANCGNHMHNETWWEDSTPKQVVRTCPNGTDTTKDTFGYQIEHKCFDGTDSATGQTRLTSLQTRGNCGDEKNCGMHQDGSVWQVETTPIKMQRDCSNGDKVDDLYRQYKEIKCVAGEEVDTGRRTQGDRYNAGICSTDKNCGMHANGDRWWEVASGMLTEPHLCSDGTTTTLASYKKLVEKKCVDGVTTTLDGSKRGDLISVGSCPYRDCGKYGHGDTWYDDKGKESKTAVVCPVGPFAPPPYDVYSVLEQYSCNDGTSSTTGNTMGGGKKRTEGMCYACAPDSQMSCPIDNGSGQKTCSADGSGYGSCQVTSCSAGYRKEGNTCVKMICEPNSKRSCDVGQVGATGEQTCNAEGSAWGSCMKTGCASGYAAVGEMCLPVICQAGSKSMDGCAQDPAGKSEKTCNATGTAYGSCTLSCNDGSNPRDGKCVTFAWAPTDAWTTCSADCGGQQSRIFVCKNNFGEVVADNLCTQTKPSEARACDGKTGSWSGDAIAETTREICPNFSLGYIEKSYSTPVSYSCVNGVKTASNGTKALVDTKNLCTAIQPARCSHDSLSIQQATGRLEWMKKCQDQVPAIKEFFAVISSPDQLAFYLNDTSSKDYGKPRARPLYATFSDASGNPWIAPKPAITAYIAQNTVLSANDKKLIDATSCVVPAGLKVMGVCTSSCYKPDMKLLFAVDAGVKQTKALPIVAARAQNIPDIVTLADSSTLDSPTLRSTPVGAYITELVDTVHPIRVIETASHGRLEVTVGHPIIDSNGYMREAIDLKVGESLVRADGSPDRIVKITDQSYQGKVYNVMPYSTGLMGNIVIAEGFLNGSAYYQNDGVAYMNQKILRKSLTAKVK